MKNLKLAMGDMLLAEPFQKLLTYINGAIIGATSLIRAFVPINKEVSFANQIDEIEEFNDELNKTTGSLLSFDKFESLSSKDDKAFGDLEVTKALTEELREQQERYNEVIKAMSDINNKATEIGKKIKDWFVFDTGLKDDKDNPIYKWTENAKKLKIVLEAIVGIGIFAKITKVVGGIGRTIEGISKLQLGLTGIKILLTSLSSHPIILVVSSIITMLGILYTKNENLRNSINKLFSNLSRLFSMILTPILKQAERFLEILQPIINVIGNLLAKALDSINRKLEFVMNILEPILNFITKIVEKVRELVSQKLEKVRGFFGGIKDFFTNTGNKIKSWFTPAQYRAEGGTFDLRGGNALGVVNEYENELVYSNQARQIEVANQNSLEESFLNALIKYGSMTRGEKTKIEVKIEDKSSFADFTRKVTPKVVAEGKRIGLL